MLLYTVIVSCFGYSVELDDPEFQRFMKIDKEATELVGKGFIEDMFPIMVKICPTQKYKTVFAMFEELLGGFRIKFKEHEDSFDPGM